MEEDEEVILKDSPIYSHLRDVGFTEFEVSTSQNSMIGLEINIENAKYGRKNEESRLVIKICIWLLSLLNLTELRNGILHHFAVRLIKSNILVENDKLMLENFSNTVEYLVTNPELMNFEEAKTQNFTFHRRDNYIFLLSFAFGLLSILAADFGILICIVFVGVSFCYILYSYLLKVSVQNKSDFLDEIVQSIENTDKIILKANKLIKEIKVVGKGDGTFSEASYEICLCEGIFKLLESFSSIFKAGHLVIDKKRYLSEWGSIKSLFAGRLSTIITKPEDNEVMMSQLKVKFVMFLDQSSAFLAELFLHLEKDYSHFYCISINEIVTAKSMASLNQQIHVVTKLHNMASNYWFDEKERKSTSSFHPSRESYETVKSDVCGALNSLYVHSRLAVNNILTLRSFVEETLENNENANEVELLDNVQKKCDCIKNEFLSCMGCLDEVWDRAQRHYFPKLEQLKAIPPDFVNSKDTENFSGDHVTILGLADNVPVDEVFEATIGEDSSGVTLKDENKFWLSNIRQDKITRIKQMERCRRVLQEIQPILQQRREMWEEREQIALQRKNERKCEDYDICQANSKKIVIKKMEEESVQIEEIPLLIPFSGIGYFKNEDLVTDIENTSFRCDNEDDYDSDEERLKIYRRVKQDLYEDELRRLAEDKEEEEDICNQDNGDKSTHSVITDTSHGTHVDRNEIENKYCKPIKRNKSFESNFECLGAENEIRNDLDEGEDSFSSPSSMSIGVCASRSSSGGLTSSLTYPPLPLSPMYLPVSEKDFESSQFYDISIPNSALIVAQSFYEDKITTEQKILLHTTKHLNKNVISKSSINLYEESTTDYKSSETYACGNENTDCDNRSIDWSTCGFPSRNLHLEDRFMPSHDGWLSCGSFYPFLASETLQSNPTLQKFNLNEEVFGGVGEGQDEGMDSNCE